MTVVSGAEENCLGPSIFQLELPSEDSFDQRPGEVEESLIDRSSTLKNFVLNWYFNHNIAARHSGILNWNATFEYFNKK